MLHRASYIVHVASGNGYRACCIGQRISCMLHQATDIVHVASGNGYRACCIGQRISRVLHRASSYSPTCPLLSRWIAFPLFHLVIVLAVFSHIPTSIPLCFFLSRPFSRALSHPPLHLNFGILLFLATSLSSVAMITTSSTFFPHHLLSQFCFSHILTRVCSLDVALTFFSLELQELLSILVSDFF